MLLTFIRSLLSWFCSLCPNSLDLKKITQKMPPNVYFLKKLVGCESDITFYVSCPRCHSIYNYKDCVVYRNGRSESRLCSFVEFPNQVRRRVKCDTLLLRRVKQSSESKLIPQKTYPYISLTTSLTKLCNQTDFLQKCEHWRNRKASPEILTDVYDGRSFQVVDNKPFLDQNDSS